ncbi:MAG: lamin tail domain-containing protein, partial [Anaerolineae bacterium]|nr:lamin tail domain-containing protein [Anaerolineae bacterium]
STQQVFATIDPTLLDADSALQATATALPPNCILHTLADGEFPSLIAEEYGASLPDMLEINGLNDDNSRFLQIGDVLIVPLEGCSLTRVQVAAVTGADEEATAEVSGEATEETTAEAQVTVAPTITLPPTAVNAQVQIVRVLGAGDITAEGVEIRNTGGVVDLTGWTLDDGQGMVFTFPEQRLFTNGLVTIFTRRGTNTPISLYWGRSQAVWRASGGGVVTLTDADGDVQATLRLGGS